MNFLKTALLSFCILLSIPFYSQNDEEVMKEIYNQSLTNGKSYD